MAYIRGVQTGDGPPLLKRRSKRENEKAAVSRPVVAYVTHCEVMT